MKYVEMIQDMTENNMVELLIEIREAADEGVFASTKDPDGLLMEMIDEYSTFPFIPTDLEEEEG